MWPLSSIFYLGFVTIVKPEKLGDKIGKKCKGRQIFYFKYSRLQINNSFSFSVFRGCYEWGIWELSFVIFFQGSMGREIWICLDTATITYELKRKVFDSVLLSINGKVRICLLMASSQSQSLLTWLNLTYLN